MEHEYYANIVIKSMAFDLILELNKEGEDKMYSKQEVIDIINRYVMDNTDMREILNKLSNK